MINSWSFSLKENVPKRMKIVLCNYKVLNCGIILACLYQKFDATKTYVNSSLRVRL